MSSPTLRTRAGIVVGALLLSVVARAHAPHDVINELAVSPTFAIDHTVFATVTLTDNHLFLRSTDGGRSWTYIGTPMADTDPEVFAFSPDFATDGTAFAANPQSGMWRTLDAGLTWHPVSEGIPTLIVTGAAVSPDFATDRRVLAATKVGVFMSEDGGDTWLPSSTGLAELDQRRVAIVRDTDGSLLCFSSGKTFHRSFDGGFTWSVVGTFSKRIESLSVSPNFPDDQRVAVSFGRFGLGVAHSSTGGGGFQFMNNGLSDLFVDEVAIAADGAMFAAAETGGCFRTETIAGPWQQIVQGFEPLSDLTDVHNTEIVPSPDFLADQLVFAGAYEGFYRSTNRGDTWVQGNVYSQLLNRRFVLSPQYASDRQLLVGNYGGGVFHYVEQKAGAAPLPGRPGAGGTLAGGAAGGASSGGGALPLQPASFAKPFAWDARSAGLTAPWSAVLASSPGPVGQRMVVWAYAGLQQTTNEGLNWSSANKPAGVQIVRAIAFSPDFAQDSEVFLGSGLTGSYRSSNACQSWTKLDALPATLATSGIALSPDYAQDGTLYYSSRNFGIWRSYTRGDEFEQVNDGLPGVAVKTVTISPDFTADQLVLAGTYEDGMYASHDAGDTWVEANVGLPDEKLLVESVAFSPDFAVDHTVYVGLQNQGVWRSSDGAQSWQPTGPGLLGPPVEVAVSTTFTQDHTLFAGTFGGTCVSRNAGATWEPLPGYVRADDTHPALQYAGAWTTSGDVDEFCGTLSVTSAQGAQTSLEFYGSRVAWFAQRVPNGAIASVQIDADPPVLVDTWRSPADELATRVYSRNFGAPGWHVIRVTHTGTANPASTGFTLRGDGFEYSW